MDAQTLYASGKLREAITAAVTTVQKKPQDAVARGFLIELLLLAGELERADLQLDALSKIDPATNVSIALLRQLLRAETWRRQFFAEGRLPEFVEKPSEEFELRLRASIASREGKQLEALDLLTRAEDLRPHVRGTSSKGAFDDWRDLDDLVAGVLEVLTSTGKYYWIPLSRVAEIEMRKPERPRDLLWARANLNVQEGPEGEVFLPTIYAPVSASTDDITLLGRSTDWLGGGEAPMRGKGLRTFLVGEEACTILELGTLRSGLGT